MSRSWIAAAFAAALLVTTPVRAQSVPRDTVVQAATQQLADTTIAAPPSALLGARLTAAPALHPLAPAPLPAPARSSHNLALMIVGGAGLVVGAVVGGKAGGVIMVGGAVVGLVGLWKYLQ